MTHTPFERELLKRIDRTNELLEYLVMAHQPTKATLGMPSTQEIDDTVAKVQSGYMSFERAAEALGLPGFRPPVSAPPTEEQRAERFAARAAEVGLSPERAEQVSARVKTNLDQLVEDAPAEHAELQNPSTRSKRRRVKDAPQA